MVALSHILYSSSSLFPPSSHRTTLSSIQSPPMPTETSMLQYSMLGISSAFPTITSQPIPTTREDSAQSIATNAGSSSAGLSDDGHADGATHSPHGAALKPNETDPPYNGSDEANHTSRLARMIASMSLSHQPDPCPNCHAHRDPPQTTYPYGTPDDWIFVSSVIGKIIVVIWVCKSCRGGWKLTQRWFEVPEDEEQGNGFEDPSSGQGNGSWAWLTNAAERVVGNE